MSEINPVFIYQKGNQFEVLTLKEASGTGRNTLINDGWKLVTTIEPSVWFKHYLTFNLDIRDLILKP